jgi:hypothetical protein
MVDIQSVYNSTSQLDCHGRKIFGLLAGTEQKSHPKTLPSISKSVSWDFARWQVNEDCEFCEKKPLAKSQGAGGVREIPGVEWS